MAEAPDLMGRALALTPTIEAMLLGTFTKSISLGAVIISVMLGVATMSGLFYGVRFRTVAGMQALTIEALEAERDNQAAIASRVEQANVDLKATNSAQAARIQHFEKLPNMTAVIEALTKVLGDNDAHAQLRHEETILAISKIGVNQKGTP